MKITMFGPTISIERGYKKTKVYIYQNIWPKKTMNHNKMKKRNFHAFGKSFHSGGKLFIVQGNFTARIILKGGIPHLQIISLLLYANTVIVRRYKQNTDEQTEQQCYGIESDMACHSSPSAV